MYIDALQGVARVPLHALFLAAAKGRRDAQTFFPPVALLCSGGKGARHARGAALMAPRAPLPHTSRGRKRTDSAGRSQSLAGASLQLLLPHLADVGHFLEQPLAPAAGCS